MTTIQLKTEIRKVLDEVPEEVLPGVLDFVKELRSQSSEKMAIDKFLEQTLIEDKSLLKKLAQ